MNDKTLAVLEKAVHDTVVGLTPAAKASWSASALVVHIDSILGLVCGFIFLALFVVCGLLWLPRNIQGMVKSSNTSQHGVYLFYLVVSLVLSMICGATACFNLVSSSNWIGAVNGQLGLVYRILEKVTGQ